MREKDRKIDGGYYFEEKRELKAKRALKLEGENEFGVRERKKERRTKKLPTSVMAYTDIKHKSCKNKYL